ncbi:cell wall-binding repeat-containing protein [Euzebya rosea]|uniref:cell wall-binding repeat-containing protein n=1 Tax=Euzebya rosea TaxID=2052804 RepID=UPI000D3E708D|nr:cell wall-binding repeat-containing protein [Euzebya rosea]
MRFSLLIVIVLLSSFVPVTASAQGLLATADVAVDLRRSYDDDVLVDVTNRGPSEVRATAEVSLDRDLMAVDLPARCSAHGPRMVRCTTPVLRPGSRTTFPLGVVQTDRGPQQVSVIVTSTATDPLTANDRATLSIQALPSPPVGTDAVDSAVVVSRMRFRGAAVGVPHVVLARSDDFADALVGTALTGNAPLLFTARDALDARTATEIDRVMPQGGTVLVLGGTGAIAEPVLQSLRARGHEAVRLSGGSRIETALAVADRLVASGADPSTVVVARAFGDAAAAWADAIAFGAFAGQTSTPILLTDPVAGSGEVARWAAGHGTTRTLVAGGVGAVPDAALGGLPGVERIAGVDRAGTAVAAGALLPTRRTSAATAVHLVNGYVDDGWVHGLLAAGLAVDEGAPVLFVTRTDAPDATRTALTSCRDAPVAIAVVGGPDVVDPSLRTELDQLDGSRC